MSSFDNDEIDSLSYRQLQDECRKAKLVSSGTSQVLRRRLKAWNANQNKRQRSNANDNEGESPPAAKRRKSAADDLVCPITRELPFDPVTAEDGRVYERFAIKKHFRTHAGELKSPVTNEIMGQRLLPSPQFKSLIETLIEDGSITGELVVNWKKTEEEKKAMKDLLEEAEGGDTDAMMKISRNYRHGRDGFKKNAKLAYKWAEKAHTAGSVIGTTWLGYYLTLGKGVAKNVVQGMVFTTMAAAQGSDQAAYHLGYTFGKGTCGLPVDTTQAILWLQRCLSDDCLHKCMNEHSKEKAHELLQELMNATISIELSDDPSNGSFDDSGSESDTR